MSDFVSRPDAPAAEAEPVIEIDDFWPSIDPAKLRAAQRLVEAVTAPRWRAAIKAAILTALRDLSDWGKLQEAAGHAALADVPALSIDGTSAKVEAWYRAIGCLAKAEIVERIRDIDTTGKGDRQAASLEPHIGDLRRDATHALRDILDRGRTIVELI